MKFRIDRRYVLRPFGWHMIHAGIAVVLTFVALAFELTYVAWGFGAVAVFSVLMAVRMIFLPAPVAMTLNDNGYRASWRAGGKSCRGEWTALSNVKVSNDGQFLVFDVTNDREQYFWLPIVGERSMELQSEVYNLLNKSHGYRPLT